MKFCVEAAVSAAQGGTAVGPPPKVGNWTGLVKKNFSFFSLRKSTEKNSYILLSTVTHLY